MTRTSISRLAFLSAAFIAALIAPVQAQQAPVSLRAIETMGPYATPEDGQISDNIWNGISRDDVLMLIDSLPTRYASPTYFRLAERLLLSNAPGLPAPAPEPKKKKDAPVEAPKDPNRPDVLIARLDKLLDMGALRSAERLYDSVIRDMPNNFDLAFRSLQILMLRGQLSAACLDLQAMQSVHGNDSRWKELNRLCRIQFAQGAERQRLLNETKFENYPTLGKFLRGSGNMGKLSSLSTQDLAFAVATNLVGATTLRQMTPKAGTLPPLLLSVLYMMDTEGGDMPEKTCLAIESVRRGILDTRELITLYERPHYDAALLLGTATTSPGFAVHPCMIPTVLYQRIASNKEQPLRDQTIRTALDVMKGMPDAAFLPMAVYFNDLNVRAVANKSYLWRTTRILAYEKGALPQAWESGWGAKGGQGVSPFWLVNAIVNPALATPENLNIWRGQWPSEAGRIESRDPMLAEILSLIRPYRTETSDNQKGKSDNYENKNTLTFSRTYAMPSYGLTQRLANVIEKEQTGQSVALLLIGYGAIPPDQIIPDQVALVLEGLNKAGLRQDSQRFALEVLR